MCPSGTGAPPTGATAQLPPEKYLLNPFVNRVLVYFLPFQLPAPLSRQGTKHGGYKGVVVQGCGGIGVPGL